MCSMERVIYRMTRTSIGGITVSSLLTKSNQQVKRKRKKVMILV